jgi:hypothetical protein
MKKIVFIVFLILLTKALCFADDVVKLEQWQKDCMDCNSKPVSSCVFNFKENYLETKLFDVPFDKYKGGFESFCVDENGIIYALFGKPEPEVVVFDANGKVLDRAPWFRQLSLQEENRLSGNFSQWI